MEKLTGHTPDLTARNVARIKELFPSVVTEGRDEAGEVVERIDFDLMRQELSDHVVDGPSERYQLDWPGKRAAAFAANTPIAKTLRPDREESVDFDTTQNIFIEGDNLDALKLLQESYLGKVKLIYIDPPYNTGHDFIYDDDFAETTADYLERSGQTDEDRGRLVANTESNGRFHSDWLSMMYPRLKLARNLLTDDGLMFVSIDSGEGAGLRILCDLVFGATNYVDTLIWRKKVSPSNDSRYFSNDHEQILVYSRRKQPGLVSRLPRNEGHDRYYRNPDNDERGRWNSIAAISNKSAEERPNLYYPIIHPTTGAEVWPPRSSVWKYAKDTFARLAAEGRLYWGKGGDSELPRIKKFLNEAGDVVPRNILDYDEYGSTQTAAMEYRELMPDAAFSYPKPSRLISGILALAPDSEDPITVLDFFGGSGTTAHAVMALNAQDGGARRHISVQLAEATDDKSEAGKAGYATIAELARERIRRAGAKIKEEAGLAGVDLDVGFRAFRIDSSNRADVRLDPDETEQLSLDSAVLSIKQDRSAEDLLFQVLLEYGLQLSLPIVSEDIDHCAVFDVDSGSLIFCKLTGDMVYNRARSPYVCRRGRGGARTAAGGIRRLGLCRRRGTDQCRADVPRAVAPDRGARPVSVIRWVG